MLLVKVLDDDFLLLSFLFSLLSSLFSLLSSLFSLLSSFLVLLFIKNGAEFVVKMICGSTVKFHVISEGPG